MQKKLIALAVAGLASTAAFAQSNVTVYGVMDASIDMINVGDSPWNDDGRNETQFNSNNSRIGVKGSEDLGGGLKAVYQIESSIGADGTAGSLNSRNTFVGLSGNFGTVVIGRQDTPYKMATRSLDLFADHLGDNRNLMGQSVLQHDWQQETAYSFDGRQSNQLAYMSPDFNGFAFAVAYVNLAEGYNSTSGTRKDRAISLNGSYTNGPWYGTLAYEKHDLGTGMEDIVGTDEGDTQEAMKLGVGYKQDALRVNFVYERTDADIAWYGSDADLKRNAWTLGAGYTVGSNEFKVAFTKVGDFKYYGSDTGAKQWVIGVDHVLSRRTKLYAEYVKLSNEDNAWYGLNGASTSAANETGWNKSINNWGNSDPSALSLGIRHSF